MCGSVVSFSSAFTLLSESRAAYRGWKLCSLLRGVLDLLDRSKRFKMNTTRRESVGSQPFLTAVYRLASHAYGAEPSEQSSDKREHEAVHCALSFPQILRKRLLALVAECVDSYS